MTQIVSVKFREAGKQYHFNAHEFTLKHGDRVIVETDRGRALATVVTPPRELAEGETPKDLKSVLRLATDEDFALAQSNAAKEDEAFVFCQQRIQHRKMEMKLVRAEYLFDGSKIIFYFTADGRVDFRELVKDLAHYFHTRIEMRQIGVRDEAKLIGGIGICGRELCCCTFLTEFTPVSVRMAKEQGLALNPSKISGQCGRLLCCLSYEFETYCSLKKALPKCGRKVKLDGQPGEVINQDVLGQKVLVRLADGKTVSASAEEVEQGKGPAPPPPPSADQPPARRKSSGGAGRSRQRPAEKKPKPPEAQKAAPQQKPDESPAGQPENKPARKRNRSRRRPRRK